MRNIPFTFIDWIGNKEGTKVEITFRNIFELEEWMLESSENKFNVSQIIKTCKEVIGRDSNALLPRVKIERVNTNRDVALGIAMQHEPREMLILSFNNDRLG